MAFENERESLFGRPGTLTRDYFQMGVSPQITAGQLQAGEALRGLDDYSVMLGDNVYGKRLAELGRMRSSIGTQLASGIANVQNSADLANIDAVNAQALNRRSRDTACLATSRCHEPACSPQ